MHRYGIESEMWFELAKAGLERRGFRLRVQHGSIIVEKDQRLPRLMGSAREFLEFAERQGLRVELAAFEAADRYGDSRSDLSGRVSDSPFETPVQRGKTVTAASRLNVEATSRPVQAPGVFGRAALAEPNRATAETMAGRMSDVRQAQAQAGTPGKGLRELEQRCAELERRNAELELSQTGLRSELARAAVATLEAAKQRDLYQMSAGVAEERVRALQAELQGAGDERGPDKRFNQLRRYLARELHPDLAGEDAAARAIREVIFKRVWAKIEQLQSAP